MANPVINLAELKDYSEHSEGKFQGRYADISGKLGAKKLGFNLTVCPPGKSVCPYHNHHSNEEMFFVLEGEGSLRYGEKEYPIKPFDVIACPPGGRETAHQIVNTGKSDLKYLAISTKERSEICEYPDSGKVGVYVGEHGRMDFRHLFKLSSAVEYFDGEI